jgi:hypothetical protein
VVEGVCVGDAVPLCVCEEESEGVCVVDGVAL